MGAFNEKILTKCIDCGEEIVGFRNRKRCYKCAALAEKKRREEYVKRRAEAVLKGEMFVPRRTIYEKNCTVCGRDFSTTSANADTCFKCGSMIKQRKINQMERAARKQKKMCEILKKCCEMGISYGKYKEMERDGKL